MNFIALEISLDLIRALREPLKRIAQHDANLAEQMRDALRSVPGNLAEGRRRVGKDRPHHFRIAAGSADEALTGARTAEAFGYIDAESIAPALTVGDRLLGMLWSLTR